jgi:hypothetical protein
LKNKKEPFWGSLGPDQRKTNAPQLNYKQVVQRVNAKIAWKRAANCFVDFRLGELYDCYMLLNRYIATWSGFVGIALIL